MSKTCSHCVALEKELSEARAEIKKLQNALQKAQRTNTLSGLPNKVALDDALEKALAENKRHNRKSFLFFIDLDNFKQLNDTYSHEFGDEVLLAIAKNLVANARATDAIFHLSGDEFVVLAETNQPERIKHKFQQAMATTTVIYNHHHVVNIGGSIGFSAVEGLSAKSVIETADKALQYDKNERESQGFRYKRTA
jgi:diguanylate cyclase (GGDEF)-like protein